MGTGKCQTILWGSQTPTFLVLYQILNRICLQSFLSFPSQQTPVFPTFAAYCFHSSFLRPPSPKLIDLACFFSNLVSELRDFGVLVGDRVQRDVCCAMRRIRDNVRTACLVLSWCALLLPSRQRRELGVHDVHALEPVKLDSTAARTVHSCLVSI